MKVTQEQTDFVVRLIEEGDPAGDTSVYVDVMKIVEQFEVTWSIAMIMMRRVAKKCGYRVIAGNRVSALPAAGAKSTKFTTRGARARADASSFMQKYGENSYFGEKDD